ncbi:hypothetical protein PoB_006760600 [Plakobranchus ocellatus]|uniref:Uncharacterized protein n=1 Tax=Plakobranchus ocellatus TaxID=259542 RepID=A0AAV4DB00_9GAST|nr:hypothetical protein PoB_006760600 [Plakobranchus ocellatus]
MRLAFSIFKLGTLKSPRVITAMQLTYTDFSEKSIPLAQWVSLQAPSSFHVPKDDITDGVRDAQRLHFSTKERRPQADDCLLSQQRSVALSRTDISAHAPSLKPILS